MDHVVSPGRYELIERARSLIPQLRARSAQAEAEGRIPEESIAEITELGLFDIAKPRRYGGYEMGWDVFMRVAMEIGAGCGSTGWVYSVLGQHPLLVNRIGIAVMDEIWQANPNALIAATKHLSGGVRKVEGGYRGSGVATFGSGSLHSDWVVVGGIPVEGEDYRLLTVLPIGDVELLDSWNVIGLAGTGSVDLRYDDIFIPDHRAKRPGIDPAGGIIDAPLYRTTGMGGPFGLSSVLLGVARCIMELFVDSMRDRRSRDGAKLADIQSLQMRVGESAVEIDAATALLETHLAKLMETLESAPPPSGGGGYEAGRWPILGAMGIANHRWPMPGTGDDCAHIAAANAYIAQLACRAGERLCYAAGATQLTFESDMTRCLRNLIAGSRQYGINWDVARTRAGVAFLGG